MQAVTTLARLDRAASEFVPAASPVRLTLSPQPGLELALALRPGAHEESSLGDPMHKLVLVQAGMLDLEGAAGGWLVLPRHMVFIPADRPFSLRTRPDTRLAVVHLDPGRTPWCHHGCWVTRVPPLAQHLVERALAWDEQTVQGDALAGSLLRTLALLCPEWFGNPRMLWMPAARSEAMRTVVRYVADNLASASATLAAQAAGLSQRTLQRRCLDELQMSWRGLLREVRMMRALELLCQGSPVGSVAGEVGFESLSAFTVAFRERFGMPPSAYPQAGRTCLHDAAARLERERVPG
ncbi:AraC family transcriptional regulator [Geminicoccus harenae]|uniref:AraC family transcriptional regulator n=1 Tax=Geminicoccus harenae TaxID=2498453 RepID=UPI00168ACC91|nr:helix-turn-helix transcriptional regulator [Geminicoccus harenae]